MKIGLTYDLRSEYLKLGFSEIEVAEFDKDETIDGIENSLRELNFETERIGHIKNLVSLLSQGKRWDLVFNIAEGMYGIGRESQIPALLDAYKIPYTFSDPLVLSLTLHKGITKHIIRGANIPTADFFVVENEKDIAKINLPFPLFVKPAAEGSGKGISERSKVTNFNELNEVCEILLKEFQQPLLVETYLSGREFTVGIVGTGEKAKVIGMVEVILNEKAENNAYSYQNKENYTETVEYQNVTDSIFEKCAEVALKSWRILNCRDAGRIDLRCDNKGIPNFIEVNPLAGLNYLHSDLPIIVYKNGYSFTDLIKIIVDSALERVKNV